MKRVTIVAFLLCLQVASAKDLKTLDGATYRNMRLSSKTPAGVNITHATGACYIPFSNMSTNDQCAYGYDSVAASTFLVSQEENRKRQEEATATVPFDLSAIPAVRLPSRTPAIVEPQAEAVPPPVRVEGPVGTPSRYSSDYSSKSYSGSKYANKSYGGGGRTHVSGYYRKDGTYVRPHTRRR